MFNIEEFDIKLDTETIGRNFIYCETIDSTNSALLSSKEFDKDGTVLLSEFQTEGRGRKNREWISSKDMNLTFSVLLRNVNHDSVNLMNLGASLAVAQAIENLYQLKVELKWPNDVLVSRRKVAGILLQSSTQGKKLNKLVVGIGINVNQPNFTGKFIITPTSIRREFGEVVSRERLLSEVLNIYEENLNILKNDKEKILEDWKTRCRMLGEKIKIEEDGNFKYGLFDDIDSNGFLILKIADKTEKINIGDVSLRQ